MIDEVTKQKYRNLEQQMNNLKNQINDLNEIHKKLIKNMKDTITLNNNIIEKNELNNILKNSSKINDKINNEVMIKIRNSINSKWKKNTYNN